MAGNAPEPGFRVAGEPEGRPLEGRSLEAFKQLMAESLEAQKAKSKAMKVKKQQARLLKNRTLSDQFKRTQRYLGLRPTANAATTGPYGPSPAIDPVCIIDESSSTLSNSTCRSSQYPTPLTSP
jgi:hypothetical protein